MEQNQTAIEWLFRQLWEEPKDKMVWYAILDKAKEMEKEQIIDMANSKDKKCYCTNELYCLHCQSKQPNL